MTSYSAGDLRVGSEVVGGGVDGGRGVGRLGEDQQKESFESIQTKNHNQIVFRVLS